MNLAVFYDTETTGLPLFKEPSEHPGQPHIVQLGACLVDLDTRKTLATIDVICKPDGWIIPDDVAAIHGITTEHAADVGVPESLAVEMLLELVGERTRIAHNEQFDARIVRIACMRHFEPTQADAWKEGPAECTALLATPILKLPPTDRMRSAGCSEDVFAEDAVLLIAEAAGGVMRKIDVLASASLAVQAPRPAHSFENPGGMWTPDQMREHAGLLKSLGLGIDPAQLADPMSPLLSSRAFLQSIIPAPVFSRSSLTSAAEISAI